MCVQRAMCVPSVLTGAQVSCRVTSLVVPSVDAAARIKGEKHFSAVAAVAFGIVLAVFSFLPPPLSLQSICKNASRAF